MLLQRFQSRWHQFTIVLRPEQDARHFSDSAESRQCWEQVKGKTHLSCSNTPTICMLSILTLLGTSYLRQISPQNWSLYIYMCIVKVWYHIMLLVRSLLQSNKVRGAESCCSLVWLSQHLISHLGASKHLGALKERKNPAALRRTCEFTAETSELLAMQYDLSEVCLTPRLRGFFE